MYSNRVTSENKEIRTAPLHSTLECLLFSLGSSNSGTTLHGGDCEGGGGGGEEKLKRRKPQFMASSRLRDGGEKSFSKKKYEKRAGAVERQGGIFPVANAPFRKSRESYFLRAWHRLPSLGRSVLTYFVTDCRSIQVVILGAIYRSILCLSHYLVPLLIKKTLRWKQQRLTRYQIQGTSEH